MEKESVPLLRNDFDHFVELNNLQHDNIITKLDVINTSLEKDLGSHDKRIEKLEKEVDGLKSSRIYIAAIATLLAFLLPYLIQIGLALLH